MDMLFFIVALWALIFLLYMSWHDPVIGLILLVDLIFGSMLWLHVNSCA